MKNFGSMLLQHPRVTGPEKGERMAATILPVRVPALRVNRTGLFFHQPAATASQFILCN
jgi:hypothetical protein